MTNDEGNVVKISPFSHIQLSLATSEREKVVTKKGRNDEGRLTKGI